MNQMTNVYVDMIINVLQSLLIVTFLTNFLTAKYRGICKWIAYTVGVILLFFAVTIFNCHMHFEGMGIFVPILINYLYAEFFLNGKRLQKMFCSVLIMILIVATSTIVLILFGAITQMTFLEFSSNNHFATITCDILVLLIQFNIAAVILKKKKQKNLHSISVYWADWVPVIVISMLSIFSTAYILTINTDETAFLFTFLAAGSVIATNGIAYFYFVRIQTQSDLRLRYTLLQQRMKQQQKQMEDLKPLYHQMRVIRHDIKQYSSMLSAYIEQGKTKDALDYLKRLNGEVAFASDEAVHTDYDVLDYMINSKLAECKKLGIHAQCVIQQVKLPMPEDLFVIMLGNVIDNAIEGALHSQRKQVFLRLSEKNQFLSLIVENSIDASILKSNPNLKTTKQDTLSHGLGVASIRQTVERYGGMIEFYESTGFFGCNILLNLH